MMNDDDDDDDDDDEDDDGDDGDGGDDDKCAMMLFHATLNMYTIVPSFHHPGWS